MNRKGKKDVACQERKRHENVGETGMIFSCLQGEFDAYIAEEQWIDCGTVYQSAGRVF